MLNIFFKSESNFELTQIIGRLFTTVFENSNFEENQKHQFLFSWENFLREVTIHDILDTESGSCHHKKALSTIYPFL